MKTKLFKIIFFLIIIDTLFVSNAFAEIIVTPLSHDYGRTENNYTFSVESSPPELVKVGVSEKPTWVSVNPADPSYLTVLHPQRDVIVTVNRTGLAPGSYQGTVTFAIFKTWETIPVVDVTVSMIVPNPPELSVSPDSYNFGTSGTSCQFSVQNTGESTLNWSATAPSWLTLNSYVGILGQGALQFVTATVNRGALAPGTYTGTISFTSNGGDKDVPVSMTVPEPDPELSVGPTSHDFGTSETSCQFAVTNTGGGTLNWSVSEGISWLSLSLSGGSVGPGASQFVTATVNRGGLSPETYTGTISFTSNGGNQNVPVSMTVPEPDPELSVSPISHDFGTSETSYQFTITNTGGGTLNWSVSEGIPWLSLSLSGGNVGPGASQFVTATVNRGGLAPGTYTGTISFTSSYGDQDVPVSMTVPDTTPPTGTISINGGDEYTDSTSVTLTLSASDSSGVSKMKFSNDGVEWSVEEDTATSKSWTLTTGDGEKRVYVQYKDNAGNWSTPPLSISDTIVLDTTPPTGTISINGGDVYTSTTSVTLTLSASDSTSGVSKMKFSNDGANWSSEEDYAPNRSWTLAPGDETKTVYVQYKDNAGRWSTPPLSISDTIVLDTTAPTGTISINGGAAYTDSISVILTLSAEDSGSGVSKMKFSNDGV
ncbi:MAG: Ig-like domain-containing protein, partial [bacterium]